MILGGFFHIQADPAAYRRWILGSPLDPHGYEVDPRLFVQGVRVDGLSPLTVPIYQVGEEVDFNFCAFDMPVTPRTFNEELGKLVGGAIQRIPVTVGGDSERFEILNICNLGECVDENRSKHILKWKAEDGRPDKTGKYRMVIGLKVEKNKIFNQHIIRILDWPIPIIVSHDVRDLADSMNLTGIIFEQVD